MVMIGNLFTKSFYSTEVFGNLQSTSSFVHEEERVSPNM